MKLYLQIAIASSLLLTSVVNYKCDSKEEKSESGLLLAGVVDKIGKHPGATSGGYKIYQLVRYRVAEVCTGTYNQKEIVVDHLLVSGEEVKSLRVGEKVYLTLTASKTIETRFDEEGLRSASDNVETFYIGHTPDTIRPAACNE
jgi:hypothetical protein